MPQNKSAFLDAKDAPLRVGDSEPPKPGPNDIIVRNYAVGVNTIDPAQQAGFLVTQYPTVLGHDLAGEVYEIGSSVTSFKKGDRVLGHGQQFLTSQAEDGAFSLYSLVPAGNAAVLPSRYSYTQGAVLPLAIDTAAAGFCEEDYLNMDLPSQDPKPNGKVLVVYGGSSSVGIAATQLAVAAGYRVIATSSSRNFDLVHESGASEVFDYRDPKVAYNIAEAVGKDEFVGLYNAIGIPESFDVVTPIMQKLGGGFVANTKPPGEMAKGIPSKHVLGVGDFSFLWEKHITPLLESGQLKCLPEANVVGKGLESLQKAFEIRGGDIHAQKIVVEL